eukprot:s200_g40.t1
MVPVIWYIVFIVLNLHIQSATLDTIGLPLDFVHLSILTEDHDAEYSQTSSKTTESQGSPPVVLAQKGICATYLSEAATDLLDSEESPFQRLPVFESAFISHVSSRKCPLAMCELPTVTKRQCDSLPGLPDAVAVGNGSQLRRRSPRGGGKGDQGGKGKDAGSFGQQQPFQQFPYPPVFQPPMQPQSHQPPLPPPAVPPPWMQYGPPMQSAPVISMMPNSMTPNSAGTPTMMMPGPSGPLGVNTGMSPAGMPAPSVATMTMPSPALPPALDASTRELINYIQKRQADLPPDVQRKVQDHSRKEGKRATKDLHSAVSMLDEAKAELEEALLARSQHIGTWKHFLAEAVKNWAEYGSMFAQHEQALQSRIQAAKEQFTEAKEVLEASKAAAGEVHIQEISDEEDLAARDSDTSARQIGMSIQSLSTSLQQLRQEAEHIKVEVPGAKRPRTEEPNRTEVPQTMPMNAEVPSFP